MSAGTDRTARELWSAAWDAIEANRLDDLDDLFVADVQMSTATGGSAGIAFVKGVFSRHLQSYPDLRHRVSGIVESADGTALAAEIVFAGTHRGSLRHPDGSEIPPTGRQLEWTAVDWIHSSGGRIDTWHAHFDRLSLMSQLGLLPATPAPAEPAPAAH